MTQRQPLLHEQVVLVCAPAQVLSDRDGSLGAAPIQGVYHSDVRVLRRYALTVTGSPLEPLSAERRGAAASRHRALARGLDPCGADPRTLVDIDRSLSCRADRATLTETLTLHAARREPTSTVLSVELAADLSPIDMIKNGGRLDDLPWDFVDATTAAARRGPVRAVVHAPGARLELSGTALRLHWDAEADAAHPFSASWSLSATAADAVVQPAPPLPARRRRPVRDARAAAWLEVAFDDLDHLLLTRRSAPAQPFAAAGAPWFLTLFGRDSLWTARLLLEADDPWSLALAEGTLRTLAELQGTRHDPETAEQPGKIMHELRRAAICLDADTMLPPLYYGTIDATELWILTLAEAHRAGLESAAARDLLPALREALRWLIRYADTDGDGFIEYTPAAGAGLANQGWKDSGDSIQFADGSIARAPIALVEVQAYAYAAALAGAGLLEELGDAADAALARELTSWAAALRRRFTGAFWRGDAATGFPVIALDAHKRQVDSLSSNIGHLLGTGILDPDRARRVAELLVSPELDSGYGLRTLASTMSGYWPLSYHGGSVWTHDTAIAIDGLLRDGFPAQARLLAESLLAAAPHFGNRMPELLSGASADDGAPVPYPASCRPQAWAAAAGAVVARAV
ncbi:Amylo-alpha-1,6-glucosidase [Actinomyces ruminicola]|uniref:Amylo-alpha-1,6-glucosidase n=1 Tax=Actinomyces ruminicola TaxID=332524 RepID=A0A1H0AMW7_9ACTO|nr:glycogen debranching N-terminal domain-containing protein [Actinomyces ruminicola]SDN34701.1 Amylo-alpha-1,6-glucosidase [Actinomyces ruminicola]